MESGWPTGERGLAILIAALLLGTLLSNTMREFLLFGALRAVGEWVALLVRALMTGLWRLARGVLLGIKVWIVYTLESVHIIVSAIRSEWTRPDRDPGV